MKAEDFDKFAQGVQAKAQAVAAAPAPEAPAAIETPAPAVAAPAPAEPAAVTPADAAPAPVEAVTPTATPPAAAATEPPPTPTPAEPAPADTQRDSQGRFVKVGVHVRKLAEKDREIEALKAQVAATTATPTPRSIEALDKLKEKFQEKFPAEFQELIGALSSELLTRDEQLEKMSTALKQYEATAQAEVATEAAAVQNEVDTAIEANPTLKAWKAGIAVKDATPEAKALWDAVAEHDRLLRVSPSWADKPLAQRFDEAVARTAKDFGITLAPPAATPAAKPALPANPQPKPLPAAPVPASLSQIPSGTSPATPHNPAAHLTLHGAINATRGMTRQQAERLLLGGG